jgi:RNA polymerase sigma-70 factor (ECF subfamily)
MAPARPADETDEELMIAYARGDARAFEALYARHRSGVYRYLLRNCGDPASAQELFQDVWTSVIRARTRYAPTARFASWLYTLAHHRIVDHWRASAQATLVPIEDDGAPASPAIVMQSPRDHEPDEEASRREAGVRLRAAVSALPPAQRDAFLLQHEGGLSLTEIAQLTGVGTETVKSRLRYAIAKLRSELRVLREGV